MLEYPHYYSMIQKNLMYFNMIFLISFIKNKSFSNHRNQFYLTGRLYSCFFFLEFSMNNYMVLRHGLSARFLPPISMALSLMPSGSSRECNSSILCPMRSSTRKLASLTSSILLLTVVFMSSVTCCDDLMTTLPNSSKFNI